MTALSLGRGLVHLVDGTDFSWTPGPPIRAEPRGSSWTLAALGALAGATREGLVSPDPARPVEVTVTTPGGDVLAEVQGSPGKPGLVLLELALPRAVRERVMIQMVATATGIPAPRIMASKSPVQVVDAGLATLVVPVEDVGDLAAFKDVDPSRLAPEARAVAAYAVTQRRPYVKLAARCAPAGSVREPLVAAALAGHALDTRRVRPDYPITRVVVSPADGAGRIECRCHVASSGVGHRWVRLRVGAEVDA